MMDITARQARRQCSTLGFALLAFDRRRRRELLDFGRQGFEIGLDGLEQQLLSLPDQYSPLLPFEFSPV